jgi:hypothetical protein
LFVCSVIVYYLHYYSSLSHHNAQAASNQYLHQLSFELLDAYEADQLDAFGLHVHGMVLKKIPLSINNSNNHPTPHAVLIQSLLQFPYNWSAWLDLADIIVNNNTNNDSNSTTMSEGDDDDEYLFQSSSSSRQVECDIEEHIRLVLAGRFEYD